MKKIFLVLVLVLSLVFIGFAENTEKQASVQKNSFRVDPALFWTFLSTVVIRSNWKCGITLLGIDITGFEYKNWNFLGVGGGLAAHYKRNPGYYYDPYWGWRYKEYDTEFWPYLKLVPVKYRWDWLSRILKIKTYVEVSVTTKKEFVAGLTFNWSFGKKGKIKY